MRQDDWLIQFLITRFFWRPTENVILYCTCPTVLPGAGRRYVCYNFHEHKYEVERIAQNQL